MPNIADLIIHPARMRILQFVGSRESATVAEIAAYLPDIPKPSLYRHVRTLAENDILLVVREEKIRGTYEQHYALTQDAFSGSEQNAQVHTLALLTRLLSDFTKYFADAQNDPIADRLFLAANTLYLNEDDFEAYIEELFGVTRKYLDQPSPENGKPRMITCISSPAGQKEEVHAR